MYKILEARIKFKNNQLERITVLVDFTNNQSKPLSDVRAIYATSKPSDGYMHIQQGETISDKLLQEVAGYGKETDDRDKIFPKWKSKYKQ